MNLKRETEFSRPSARARSPTSRPMRCRTFCRRAAQAQAALHRHLQPIRQLRGATKEISALVQKVTLDLQQETVEVSAATWILSCCTCSPRFLFLAD